MNAWPDHLPDWVFWLLVVVMPALFALRTVWKTRGSAKPPPPTRMAQADVIMRVREAIERECPGQDVPLHVAEWPRSINEMIWTIREASIGSWWIAQVDDMTGDILSLTHEGVR